MSTLSTHTVGSKYHFLLKIKNFMDMLLTTSLGQEMYNVIQEHMFLAEVLY